MKYPKKLELNDFIGVTAPSSGIIQEKKILKLNMAVENIKKLGFKYIETANVRKYDNGRSSSGEQRANEFMQLWNNPEVCAIIMATGGDFLLEMLEYLDWKKIKNSTPKWIQGYSDITGLSFLITTILDIATIYGDNIKSYGMKNLYKNLLDSLEIMKGKEITQKSYEKCLDTSYKENKDIDLFEGYVLTKENRWKNVNTEQKNIKFTGRSLGGCFDVIINLIGTKYDRVNNYIDRYKEDGIIWFFDIYEMSSVEIYLHLWQMKNAGYFKYCKGILFGRPLIVRENHEMNYIEAISKALDNLQIPIIYDADIGHIPPQMPIVNGAILEIDYIDGICNITNRFK